MRAKCTFSSPSKRPCLKLHHVLAARVLCCDAAETLLHTQCAVCWCTRSTLQHGFRDFVHGHSPASSQTVRHFGFSPGQTQLPGWPQLTLKEALSSDLGKLNSAVPGHALAPIPRSLPSMVWPHVPNWWALLSSPEFAPQTRNVRLTCAAQAQVLSLSSKRCRSASRARPQPMVRSPNDRRLHLSLHHRPCVTMAAVGRMAASTRALRRLLRVYLSGIFLGQVPPRAPRPTSTRRASFRVASRCASATKARTQRPSCPASLRPRADQYPPQPSQVARWSPP